MENRFKWDFYPTSISYNNLLTNAKLKVTSTKITTWSESIKWTAECEMKTTTCWKSAKGGVQWVRQSCQTFQSVLLSDNFEDMFEFLDQNPCCPHIWWTFRPDHCEIEKKRHGYICIQIRVYKQLGAATLCSPADVTVHRSSGVYVSLAFSWKRVSGSH